MTSTKREERYNLLLMNLSVLYDSKKTLGDLVSTTEAKLIFEAFRQDLSHQEPTERWDLLCDGAINILMDPEVANVPAKIGCEVQVTFGAYKDARHDTHLSYEIARAAKAVQLYNQFAGAGLTEAERAPAKDFWTACYRGQLRIAMEFLTGGADVNATGGSDSKTALFVAADNNHPDIVALLLKADPPAKQDEEVALRAAKNGYSEITEQLSVSGELATKALFVAVENNREPQTKAFILSGAKSNELNADGYTHLTLAAKAGATEAAAVLVDLGKANPDKVDANGNTPLALAVQTDNTDLVSVLLEAKVDPDGKSSSGESFIFIAARNGNRSMVAAFADAGAMLSGTSQHDAPTTLWIAASEGHADVVQYLVDKNTLKLNQKSVGTMPLRMAQRNQHNECVDILLPITPVSAFENAMWKDLDCCRYTSSYDWIGGHECVCGAGWFGYSCCLPKCLCSLLDDSSDGCNCLQYCDPGNPDCDYDNYRGPCFGFGNNIDGEGASDNPLLPDCCMGAPCFVFFHLVYLYFFGVIVSFPGFVVWGLGHSCLCGRLVCTSMGDVCLASTHAALKLCFDEDGNRKWATRTKGE